MAHPVHTRPQFVCRKTGNTRKLRWEHGPTVELPEVEIVETNDVPEADSFDAIAQVEGDQLYYLRDEDYLYDGPRSARVLVKNVLALDAGDNVVRTRHAPETLTGDHEADDQQQPERNQRRSRVRREAVNVSTPAGVSGPCGVEGESAMWLFEWIGRGCRHLVLGPNYENTAAYRNALAWYQAFRPEEGFDYGPAYEYAKLRLADVRESFTLVDTKAERLVQFATAIAGAVIAGVKLLSEEQDVLLQFLPSLVFFGVAIALALLAKRTTAIAAALKISDALGLRGTESEVKARLAASLHCATVGTRELVHWKANRYDAATWCVIVGVVLLSLPLFL